MLKRFAALISIFILFPLSAQWKQKIADQFYVGREYAKCVEMYDELAQKCIKNNGKGEWENVRRAAECHYHLFEMDRAEMYFETLQKKNLLTENDRMHYIHALRYNQKYGSSHTLITESSRLFPENTFFKRLYSEIGNFDQLFLDSALYTVRPTQINSSKGDFGPAFYQNSVVYVSKSRNTGFLNPKYGWDDDYFLNVMQAELGKDSLLTSPVLLKHQFISRAHDGPVSFNKTGTKMVITKNSLEKRNGKDVVVLSLYFSEYENGEWSPLFAFEYNDKNYNVGHAVYSPDESRLYFVSDQPGGFGESDLYYCDRLGDGWATPQNMGAHINTERDELFPFVDDKRLYFASNGHFGLGGLDIFETELTGTTRPRNIGFPVNTAYDDFAYILNKDGITGYFSSNRNDNIDRIYQIRKNPISITLEGVVYEMYAKPSPVSNHKVWIRNMTTQAIDSMFTDNQGAFQITLNRNQDYRVYTTKPDFVALNEVQLSTHHVRSDSIFTCILNLKPTNISIRLRVIEKENREVIPLANVTLTDYGIQWDTLLITDSNGIVTLDVDRNKILWAHGAKKGFIDADVSFNTTNEVDKIIDLELALPTIKKGEKFKLENIFYDLNKSTLRPESMASLDKLADFIVKNDLKIELSAHTDSRGSNSYNLKLSQARAQSCVDYLLKKGVQPSQIRAKGYGETQLVNHCKNGIECTEEAHQENRRTEVKILEVN